VGLITIPELLYPSPTLIDPSTGYSVANLVLNSSGDRVAQIIRVPKTGTLDKFEFLTATHTGTWSIRASFQDVDLTTGFPDGTVDQYRSLGAPSAGWQVPGLMTSDGTDGGAKRSVTKGGILACVVDFDSYTSGSFNVQPKNVVHRVATALHKVATYDGATWATQTTYMPNVALKYSDGTYYMIDPRGGPFSSIVTLGTFSSSSNPDERGMRFVWPYARAQVIGAYVHLDADGDFDMVLYDEGSNVVASESVDKDLRGDTLNLIRNIYFTTPGFIKKNGVYRIVVKPTTTTTVGYTECTLASADHQKAWPPGGRDDLYWTQRNDGGSWSDTTTKRMEIGIIVDQLDLGGSLLPRTRSIRHKLA
jgi:hypothetical protein